LLGNGFGALECQSEDFRPEIFPFIDTVDGNAKVVDLQNLHEVLLF
jgi:hypothetical protein